MKRFLISACLFLLVSIAVYFGMMWALNTVEVGGIPFVYRVSDSMVMSSNVVHDRYWGYQESSNNDVVVLGSSHAFRGYDPRVFEAQSLSMYNLGSHSQALDHTRLLLDKFVEHESTDLVIIDLYEAIFTGHHYESGATLLPNIPDDQLASDIAWSLDDIRAVNMMTLRYLDKGKPPRQIKNKTSIRGYEQKLDSLKTEVDYSKYGNFFDCTDEARDDLLALIATAKSHKQQIVFVAHPQAKEMNRKANHEFGQFMTEVLEESGLQFLDYTFDHELHSQHHFYDHTHLNNAGAGLFTKRLIADLHRLKLLSQ